MTDDIHPEVLAKQAADREAAEAKRQSEAHNAKTAKIAFCHKLGSTAYEAASNALRFVTAGDKEEIHRNCDEAIEALQNLKAQF